MARGEGGKFTPFTEEKSHISFLYPQCSLTSTLTHFTPTHIHTQKHEFLSEQHGVSKVIKEVKVHELPKRLVTVKIPAVTASITCTCVCAGKMELCVCR